MCFDLSKTGQNTANIGTNLLIDAYGLFSNNTGGVEQTLQILCFNEEKRKEKETSNNKDAVMLTDAKDCTGSGGSEVVNRQHHWVTMILVA